MSCSDNQCPNDCNALLHLLHCCYNIINAVCSNSFHLGLSNYFKIYSFTLSPNFPKQLFCKSKLKIKPISYIAIHQLLLDSCHEFLLNEYLKA